MFFNKYTLQQVEEYKEIFNLFKDSGLESFSYKVSLVRLRSSRVFCPRWAIT